MNPFILDKKQAFLFQNVLENSFSLLITWENKFYLNSSVNGRIDK
jgi:hypothetical protein